MSMNYGDSALNIGRCPAIVLTDRFPIGTVSARVWLHRESADDDTGYTASGLRMRTRSIKCTVTVIGRW